MNRILVPVDGSPRSLRAVEEVKHNFSPRAFEIILLMVKENDSHLAGLTDMDEEVRAELESNLDEIANNLEGYDIIKRIAEGKPGNRIVECAKELGADMIVMTRSTDASMPDSIGVNATYVIRHAGCNVLIVKEAGRGDEAYRGLVYRKAEGLVNLRGRLSLKHSECMLPTVTGDTNYHIEVTRGRIRFQHISYNPDSKEWDLPPVNGQKLFYEIMEGETIDIPINAENASGKLDRIRIVNRDAKIEAVFTYKITRA